MAQYRFSAQVIGRSAGRSVVAAAAYRAGLSISDERTGLVHDFTRRGGVTHSEIMAPANTPDWMLDRAQLWNAVEAAEKRKDAQLAREVQLSLPHELSDEQRRQLVHDFAREHFVSRGMIADVAIHRPGKEGDDRNHHAHILLTMRELTAQGFGKKARDWNSPDTLTLWREAWAQVQNRALERAGEASRVDHRSYADQGIDREPQVHLGPTANEMERQGKDTRIGDENREREARNDNRADNHKAAAVVYLEMERLKRDEARVLASRQAGLKHVQGLSAERLGRRHHQMQTSLTERLQATYGTQRATLEADRNAAQSRLEATGWRKILRDVTGRSRADLGRAEAAAETLVGIDKMTAAARDELRRQIAGETAAQARAHDRKQDRDTRTVTAKFDQVRAKLNDQARPPSPEKQPVKSEFDAARKIDPPGKAAPIPNHGVQLSQPAPEPSPTGAPPAPKQPAQTPSVDRVSYWAKSPEGQAVVKQQGPAQAPPIRSYWEKAAQPQQPAPAKEAAPKRDYWNEKQAVPPKQEKEPEREKPKPSPTKDFDRER